MVSMLRMTDKEFQTYEDIILKWAGRGQKNGEFWGEDFVKLKALSFEDYFDHSFLSFVISRKISYKISAKIPSRIINAAEQWTKANIPSKLAALIQHCDVCHEELPVLFCSWFKAWALCFCLKHFLFCFCAADRRCAMIKILPDALTKWQPLLRILNKLPQNSVRITFLKITRQAKSWN